MHLLVAVLDELEQYGQVWALITDTPYNAQYMFLMSLFMYQWWDWGFYHGVVEWLGYKTNKDIFWFDQNGVLLNEQCHTHQHSKFSSWDNPTHETWSRLLPSEIWKIWDLRYHIRSMTTHCSRSCFDRLILTNNTMGSSKYCLYLLCHLDLLWDWYGVFIVPKLCHCKLEDRSKFQ